MPPSWRAQVICALGRRFIGTQYSTFTAYITRLRGYVHAPDTLIYDHNLPWSTDDEQNRARGLGSHDPEDYLEEDPRIWKDTVDTLVIGRKDTVVVRGRRR